VVCYVLLGVGGFDFLFVFLVEVLCLWGVGEEICGIV